MFFFEAGNEDISFDHPFAKRAHLQTLECASTRQLGGRDVYGSWVSTICEKILASKNTFFKKPHQVTFFLAVALCGRNFDLKSLSAHHPSLRTNETFSGQKVCRLKLVSDISCHHCRRSNFFSFFKILSVWFALRETAEKLKIENGRKTSARKKSETTKANHIYPQLRKNSKWGKWRKAGKSENNITRFFLPERPNQHIIRKLALFLRYIFDLFFSSWKFLLPRFIIRASANKNETEETWYTRWLQLFIVFIKGAWYCAVNRDYLQWTRPNGSLRSNFLNSENKNYRKSEKGEKADKILRGLLRLRRKPCVLIVIFSSSKSAYVSKNAERWKILAHLRFENFRTPDWVY